MSTATITKNITLDTPLSGGELAELDQLTATKRDADRIEAAIDHLVDASTIRVVGTDTFEKADTVQALNFTYWVRRQIGKAGVLADDSEVRDELELFLLIAHCDATFKSRSGLEDVVVANRCSQALEWLNTNWEISDPETATWVSEQLDLVERFNNHNRREVQELDNLVAAHLYLKQLRSVSYKDLTPRTRKVWNGIENELLNVVTTLAATGWLSIPHSRDAVSRVLGDKCTITLDNVDKLEGLNAQAATLVARVDALRARIKLEELRDSEEQARGWLARRAAARQFCADLRAI